MAIAPVSVCKRSPQPTKAGASSSRWRAAIAIKRGRLYLSEIYSWYRKDFGRSDAEVIKHLSLYADADLKKQLAGIESIAGYDYDWSLNEAK